MEKRLRDYFTKAEVSKMREEIASGMTLEDVAERHGIPRSAIAAFRTKQRQAKKKGVAHRKWTEEETSYLIENYPFHDLDWDGWAKLDRSRPAIKAKAESLRISNVKRPWSSDDIQYLMDNYNIHDLEWSGWDELGRTRKAIIQKASELSLSIKGRWSKEEDQFLRDNYPNHDEGWEGWKMLDRPWSGIKTRARRLKVKKKELR